MCAGQCANDVQYEKKNGIGKGEEEDEEEMLVDKQTCLRGRWRVAGCRRTARALPPRGPGPGSQPAAAP